MSDQPPSSRTDSWVDTVCEKLEEVGFIARKYGCHAVLDGGDFFNDKTPGRTTHRLVARIAQIHERYPCKCYANVGNHDVRLARLDNLNQSPLEALFSSRVFHRLYQEHEALIEAEGVSVRVVGVPYHGPRYDMDRFRRIRRGEEDWLLCVAHVLASPQGGEMFKNEDIIRYDDLKELAPDVDCFFFGHWHKNQGIQRNAAGQWVVNTGSLTRGALTQDNLDRQPGVVVGTFPHIGEPPKFEFVPITIQPATKVFDTVKRVREEARETTMDAFVESVRRDLRSNANRSFRDMVGELDIPDRVKERVLAYIEGGR